MTSRAGESYDVMREGDGWDCSCPQFAFRCRGLHGQFCKHIDAIRNAGLLIIPDEHPRPIPAYDLMEF